MIRWLCNIKKTLDDRKTSNCEPKNKMPDLKIQPTIKYKTGLKQHDVIVRNKNQTSRTKF